jgi:hypothetical protein
MADLAISIEAGDRRVAAGGQLSFVVEVRNLGTVVDRYTCDLVGMDSTWWTVSPPAIELFPERDAPEGRARADAPPTSGRFTITIRPPRTAEARAGEWPVGARVQSEHDPDSRAVEETVVEILPFGQLEADLLPSQVTARIRGNGVLALRNAGNRPETFEATASDKAKALSYEFRPESISLGAGEDEQVGLRVKPSRLILLGQPQLRPFNVDVRGDGPDTPPVAIAGMLQQHSLVPPWVPRALTTLAFLVMAAIALWALLFKPQIDDAIKQAVDPVKSQVAAIQSNLPSANNGPQETTAPETPTPTTATGTPGGPTPTLTTAPTIKPGTTSGQSFAGRVGTPNAGSSQTFNIPTGATFTLTDIFLSNTGGDGGIIRLFRGNQEMFEWNAADFRTLDDHFVTGIKFLANQDIRITWTCQPNTFASPPPGGSCNTNVVLSGVGSSK